MKLTVLKRSVTIIFNVALFLVFLGYYGCKKDKSAIPPKINGVVQKGPFLNGSSITFSELNQDYSQTGKTFSSEIFDNAGSFELDGVKLLTNYVAVKTNGFYFNEICGSNSISQITLNCIADVSSASALHINVLTHLEKPRVEYLIENGMSFDSAKATAQADVLNIFNISSTGLQHSEYLDISGAGNGNAILLAISAILQGFRTESELSLLIATIANDISTDGVLNDASAMSSLIDHAILLDTIKIRNNITSYYQNLQVVTTIPNFEMYIQQFIDNTTFTITNSVITYPAQGEFGDNILAKNQVNYTGGSFSFYAVLKRCAQLDIRIQKISGPDWGSQLFFAANWNIYGYVPGVNAEQHWNVIDPEVPADLNLLFAPAGQGTYLVEYYELNTTTPTFSKTIYVN